MYKDVEESRKQVQKEMFPDLQLGLSFSRSFDRCFLVPATSTGKNANGSEHVTLTFVNRRTALWLSAILSVGPLFFSAGPHQQIEYIAQRNYSTALVGSTALHVAPC